MRIPQKASKALKLFLTKDRHVLEACSTVNDWRTVSCHKACKQSLTELRVICSLVGEWEADSPATWSHPSLLEPVTMIHRVVLNWAVVKGQNPTHQYVCWLGDETRLWLFLMKNCNCVLQPRKCFQLFLVTCTAVCTVGTHFACFNNVVVSNCAFLQQTL